MKNFTSNKQGCLSTILNKSGKCLTESKDILNRWTEYTADLYSYRATGDTKKLNTSLTTDTDSFPSSKKEEEMKSLKKGKSSGIDNIPRELVHAGNVAIIIALHAICQKIWKRREWPTHWTQSLMITLPKKGNL